MTAPQNPETAAREALDELLGWLFKTAETEGWGWNSITTPDVVVGACVALAALSARMDAEAWQPTHKHVKRGSTYRVVGEAEGQVSTGDYRKGQRDAEDIAARLASDGDKIVVYQAEDGKLWWRFADEFEDGRFEALRPTTQTETEADDGR